MPATCVSFSDSSRQNSSFDQTISNEENITHAHKKYQAQEKLPNLSKDAMSTPTAPPVPARPAFRFWQELVKILAPLGQTR
jgi:hypothetical protein